MKNIFTVFLMTAMMIVGICSQRLTACMGALDALTAGVVLNDWETFRFSRLYKLGVEDVNYFRSCLQIKPAPGTKDILFNPPGNMDSIYSNIDSIRSIIDSIRSNSDPAIIKSVNITGNLVTLDVEYTGGCATHTFDLYVLPPDISAINPGFYLSHDAKGDDCKSLIDETISFNLAPMADYLDSIGDASPMTFYFYQPCSPPASCSHQGYVMYLWSHEQDCSVTYRSHTEGDYTMVTLENSRTAGNRTGAPRVLISLNPDMVTDMPVNFATIMDKELDWLQNMNIVTGIDTTDRKNIKQTLQSGKQYYTLQDSSMYFNQWFTGEKDQSGNWITNGIKDLCGIDFSFQLPPSPIDLTGTNKKVVCNTSKNKKITASISGAGLLKINSERNLSGSALRIISMTGRTLFSGVLNNRNMLSVPKTITRSNGWKAVSISLGKSTIVCPMVSQ